MKILLLEDDIGLADIMSEYLQDNDFELDLVYDGEEASAGGDHACDGCGTHV